MWPSEAQDVSSGKFIVICNMITKWAKPLLLFSSKRIQTAPATAGILTNMAHAQNKFRRKTDCALKQKNLNVYLFLLYLFKPPFA